jgi:hypothetical protein
MVSWRALLSVYDFGLTYWGLASSGCLPVCRSSTDTRARRSRPSRSPTVPGRWRGRNADRPRSGRRKGVGWGEGVEPILPQVSNYPSVTVLPSETLSFRPSAPGASLLGVVWVRTSHADRSAPQAIDRKSPPPTYRSP